MIDCEIPFADFMLLQQSLHFGVTSFHFPSGLIAVTAIQNVA